MALKLETIVTVSGDGCRRRHSIPFFEIKYGKLLQEFKFVVISVVEVLILGGRT